MSNGSRERESPQDVQCEHCGRWFRNDGVHGHEPNCPLRGEDVVIVELEGPDEGVGSLTEGAGTPPVDSTDGEDSGGLTPGVDPDSQDGEDGARADGGRVMDPPTPTTAPTASTSTTSSSRDSSADEDVPDHYVDADEFIARAERKNPHLARTDEWRRLRADAEQHDYVDLRETDLEAGVVELI